MSERIRRAGLFAGSESESRFAGPATGDERRMLASMLGAQRATLELKCAGLGPELAERSVEPSTLSLLGLVRHLADVERRWFRRVLAGQDAPALFSSAADPDGDFDGAVSGPGEAERSWEAWRLVPEGAGRSRRPRAVKPGARSGRYANAPATRSASRAPARPSGSRSGS
ncbi:DUF664 domain-containing protein [Streptomyces sp. 4.24]|uniref:mycothiol transferase n=1 Tax=Streptomyces tritrimontium TaxID=3406573 RepID=UPI003BB7007A